MRRDDETGDGFMISGKVVSRCTYNYRRRPSFLLKEKIFRAVNRDFRRVRQRKIEDATCGTARERD